MRVITISIDVDRKRDYLINTFSKANHKKYENYIITAIWHKLNNLNIEPVTQQYVNIGNDKYALIDMYFPQVNIGIECDEAYHKDNTINDRIREIGLADKLASVENDFELYRIDATLSIEEIEIRINEIVYLIIDKYNAMGSPEWNADSKASDIAILNGSICNKDNIQFETIIDIARCFGKNYKSMQHCSFWISDDELIWCPQLALKKNGKNISASGNNWINLLSEDWKEIIEINDNCRRGIKAKLYDKDVKRYVFAKSRNSLGQNSYRFIGTFKFDKESSSENKTHFCRVSDIVFLENQNKPGKALLNRFDNMFLKWSEVNDACKIADYENNTELLDIACKTSSLIGYLGYDYEYFEDYEIFKQEWLDFEKRNHSVVKCFTLKKLFTYLFIYQRDEHFSGDTGDAYLQGMKTHAIPDLINEIVIRLDKISQQLID